MRPNRSISALLVALAVHGALAAFFWAVVSDSDTEETKTVNKEKRFGVRLEEESLSERLDASEPPPPSKRTKTPVSASTSPQTDTAEKPEPLLAVQPEEKPFTPAERDLLPRSVLYHYGEEFFELSAGEQRYIIDNFQRIRKINEVVGTRLLRDRPDDAIDPDDSNVVEFNLHPDGTISDFRFQKNRVGTFLDELTLQTIELAHSRYPKPQQKTLIRIRVYIVVK